MTINLDQYTNTLSVTDTAANASLTFVAKGANGFSFQNSATTGAFGIELADNTSVDKITFIDFHSSAGTDFDFRLARQGGVNNFITYVNAGTGGHAFQTAGGTEQMRIPHTASAVNYVQATGGATGNAPYFSSQGSDTNISFAYTAKGTGNHDFYTSGTSFTQQFRISHTASAVNYVQVTGSATGSGPTISAQGSDTNLDLNVTAKGTGGARFNVGNGSKYTYLSSDAANNFQLIGAANTANLGIYSTGGGSIRFFTASGLIEEQLRIPSTPSAVNLVQIAGSATGGTPTISVQGSDTNIDLSLTSKGTGNVRFGTYTGTILTPTGYVEIKDSGGTVRRLLVG